MTNFIRARKVKKGKILDVTNLQGFGETAWNFFSSIYEAGWNSIPINNHNTSFRNAVTNKLNLKPSKINSGPSSNKSKEKIAKIVKLPPPIPAHPSKEILEKVKNLQ